MRTLQFLCGSTAFLIALSSSSAQTTVKRATRVAPALARAAQSSPQSSSAAPAEGTTFRPGDLFDLSIGAVPIEGDPAGMVKVYTIGADGFVNVPYAGQVRAEGLTQSELERAIQTRLIEQKIFRWPTITINVPEKSRLITVGGMVRVPQRIFWSADMTLTSALNAAGGPADFAGDKVRLTRNKKPNLYSRKRLVKSPDQDPKLLPGDQIEAL
jgi:protein involved in polysaccharide export with SLBB domain